MTAGHIDWHDSGDGKAVCAIEDDSSRKILAYGEFDSQNTENSKEVFKMAVDNYWGIHPLEELIQDHGSAFTNVSKATFYRPSLLGRMELIEQMRKETGMVSSKELWHKAHTYQSKPSAIKW